MNNRRNLEWSNIEITGDDTGVKDLELNLDEDLNDSNVEQTPQNTRRTDNTVPKNTSENQENKNNQNRSEDDEDQEERAVPHKQARQTQVDDSDEDEAPRKSGRAQRRIQNLTRIKNEQEELIARLARENQELKKRTFAEQKRNASQMRDQFKKALDDAEAQLEQAITTNDTPKVAKLSRQIADLTMRHNAYEAVSEELENTPEVEEQPVTQRTPEVPDEAKAWIQRNPWFFQDEIRHVAARAISRELTQEGADPGEKEYWEELDKRLKKKFNETVTETTQETRTPQRRGPVSSSRSEEDVGGYDFKSDPQFKRSGNRVQATPTQADREMAERLGISLEDQMKEKFKYAKQGYSGYVPIDVPGQ